MSGRNNLSRVETGAAMTDLADLLGIPREVHLAHLAKLGLTETEVALAAGGTEGYYQAADGQADAEGVAQ